MRVAVLNAPRQFDLADVPVPEPGPGRGAPARRLLWGLRVRARHGFGPWSLVWWWMQNDDDPFKRLTVTNCWAERNLMRTLRQWRREAQEAGLERIADLCDYLQADERMHVRLATEWIRKLADEAEQEELVRWGRGAVARIEGFYAGDDYAGADDVKFTFQKDGGRDDRPSLVIGE